MQSNFKEHSAFQRLRDALFFNVFIHKPDSLVFDFIERYLPDFTREFEPGGWTMYPDQPMPVLEETMHSFCFTKHPHFNAKFRVGRLDFLTKENKECRAGIKDFQLWFMNKNIKE